MNDPIPLTDTTYLEGIPGSGKTTEAAAYVQRLIESGASPDNILIIVPQPVQARIYREAADHAQAAGAAIEAVTFVGMASRAVRTYWPLIAGRAGFAAPDAEPIFLNIETAQYYMARAAAPLIREGAFAGVSLPPGRVLSQTLDNLNRAAFLMLSIDQVIDRLRMGQIVTARQGALDASRTLAENFRQLCLDNNLVDYSLAVDCFNRFLLNDSAFLSAFHARYSFVIADNIEELNAAAHDFLSVVLPGLDGGALLVNDTDAGYRLFLGAEPEGASALKKLCTVELTRRFSQVMTPPMAALVTDFQTILQPDYSQDMPASAPDILESFEYKLHTYYPQMIDWAADQVIDLVRNQGTKPGQIAVVAPYLNDSLRFALRYRLDEAGIETLSYRPSRALRAEAAARAMLTLTQLAYLEAAHLPQYEDVADALHLVIDNLDPLRARLLATAYSEKRAILRPFEELPAELRDRIGYAIGEQFDKLQKWLTENADPALPLDHFLQRLFGDLISQPGFRYFQNIEAGSVIGQLIRSAAIFRETLYPPTTDQPYPPGAVLRAEYFDLISQGLLAGFYAPDWTSEEADAVFIAPAYTFLMQNRVTDYQIWLDIGSPAWSERIDQPLTHPYLLRREFDNIVWTDDLEVEQSDRRLYTLIAGLARRCRRKLFLAVSTLSEEGFEQTGALLNVFQTVIGRAARDDVPEDNENAG